MNVQEGGEGGTATETEFEQLTAFELPSETMVTDAVFVPAAAYVLEIALEVPESASVPLHE